MSIRIPLSVPTVGPAEEAAVLAALRSGWVSSAGPQLDAFEDALAAQTGRAHAVAVSSGTAALHLALLAAGVGPGQVVICPTLTFAATVNAVCYTGARPVLVDADATGCLDVGLLAACLHRLQADGERIGAIVPVDLFGRLADHAAISALAEQAGVPVIVDAAESLGAPGAGGSGQAAILSFNGNKIITASAGGAVLTDDPALAARVRHLATQARQPVAHYEHEEIGYNYRLSNVLAALGHAQLDRLPEFLAARRAHRRAYCRAVAGLAGVRVLGAEDPQAADNCWLSALLIDPPAAGFDAAALAAQLAAAGIETRPVFKPMHRQPVFADPQAVPRWLTGTADRLYETGLMLPSSPATSPDQRGTVIAALTGAAAQLLRRAS